MKRTASRLRIRIAAVGAALLVLQIMHPGSARSDDGAPTGNYLSDIVLPREDALLPRMTGIAERRGDDLIFKLSGGETRLFNDSRLACENFEYENCLLYRLFAYESEQEVVVVWIQLLEGNDALMVHRGTGETLLLEQAPYPNPRSSFWAVVDWDIGFGGGDIQLIENKDGHFKIVGQDSRNFCKFETWAAAAEFLMICGDDTGPTEFRVAASSNGRLAIRPTGKVLTPEDFEAMPLY